MHANIFFQRKYNTMLQRSWWLLFAGSRTVALWFVKLINSSQRWVWIIEKNNATVITVYRWPRHFKRHDNQHVHESLITPVVHVERDTSRYSRDHSTHELLTYCLFCVLCELGPQSKFLTQIRVNQQWCARNFYKQLLHVYNTFFIFCILIP
jgi:hypothetical protein